MNFTTGGFMQVYDNLFKYFEYRGMTPTQPKLTPNKLKEAYINKQYIDVMCKPNNIRDVPTLYRLMSPVATKNHRNKDTLVKVFKALSKIKEIKCVVFIAWKYEKKKKDHESPFKKLKESAAPGTLPEIIVYSYELFVTVVPEHDLVPKHSITGKEEIDSLRIDPKTMPLISSKDPAVIWIGGKKKDVIKIERPSETAGRSIAYRYVV